VDEHCIICSMKPYSVAKFFIDKHAARLVHDGEISLLGSPFY
jgi:hypothetical protein